MNKTAIAITSVAVIILAVAGYFIVTADPNPQPSPTPTADSRLPTASPTSSPQNGMQSDVPEDWEEFESSELGFSIMMPPEMEEVSQQRGVKLQLLGDTQPLGTEITDGINLIFDSGTYDEDTFSTFAQNYYDEEQNDPVVNSVGSLNPTTVNGNNAYRYTKSSLGDATIYLIEKSDSEYLLMSSIVEDPNNEGFQDIVDNMLSTLTLSE